MQATEQQSIVIEQIIDAPSDKVWKALTDIKALSKWAPFFSDFKPEIGFETRFKLGASEERQYTHICKVTEVEDGRKLTYGWRYDGYPGDSYVTFTLVPEQNHTNLKIKYKITEPFPADNPDFSPENFAQGFTYTLNTLKEFVENE
jgi:uncharacterized protein YndB with AHSA1/START domain